MCNIFPLKCYNGANAVRVRLIVVVRKVHIAITVEVGVVSVARTVLAGTPVVLIAFCYQCILY